MDHFQICDCTSDNILYLTDRNASCYAKSNRVTNWAKPSGFAHSYYTVNEGQHFGGQGVKEFIRSECKQSAYSTDIHY